jgi:hypothetical protein
MNLRDSSKTTNNHASKDFKTGADSFLKKPISAKNNVLKS